MARRKELKRLRVLGWIVRYPKNGRAKGSRVGRVYGQAELVSSHQVTQKTPLMGDDWRPDTGRLQQDAGHSDVTGVGQQSAPCRAKEREALRFGLPMVQKGQLNPSGA